MAGRFSLSWMILLLVATSVTSGAGAAMFKDTEGVDSLNQKLAALPAERTMRKKAALYLNLAMLYYRQGDYQMAVDNFEAALKNDPSDRAKRQIYRYLGRSYENLTRLDKAIIAYEQAVIFDRRNWKRHRDLAVIYERTGLTDNAVTSYQKALRFNAKSTPALVGLGRTWRTLGLYENAEKVLIKAKTLGDTGTALNQELSFVYEGMGKYKMAIPPWKELLNDASSMQDWCRLIYLGTMAGDREASNEGLNTLRLKSGSVESVLFYEEFTDILSLNPEGMLKGEIVDPDLRALARSVGMK